MEGISCCKEYMGVREEEEKGEELDRQCVERLLDVERFYAIKGGDLEDERQREEPKEEAAVGQNRTIHNFQARLE